MGARLVKQAFGYAVDIPLNPNEFRLLAYMALTALDEDSTPRYFDSRESSALALGRRVVDAGYGDETDARKRAAAFEAVKVAIRGLCAIGAITCVKSGKGGQRAEFALNLDVLRSRRTTEFVTRSQREGSPFPAKKAHPSPVGRLTLPSPEGSIFPQGTTQEPQRTDEGITPSDGTDSLAAVDSRLRAIA